MDKVRDERQNVYGNRDAYAPFQYGEGFGLTVRDWDLCPAGLGSVIYLQHEEKRTDRFASLVNADEMEGLTTRIDHRKGEIPLRVVG